LGFVADRHACIINRKLPRLAFVILLWHYRPSLTLTAWRYIRFFKFIGDNLM